MYDKVEKKYEAKLTQHDKLQNKLIDLNEKLSFAERLQINYVASSEIEPNQKNYDRVDKQEQVIERIKENINDTEVKLSTVKSEIEMLEIELSQLSINELEMKKK